MIKRLSSPPANEADLAESHRFLEDLGVEHHRLNRYLAAQ
jgi:hypothetical protein